MRGEVGNNKQRGNTRTVLAEEGKGKNVGEAKKQGEGGWIEN